MTTYYSDPLDDMDDDELIDALLDAIVEKYF
ncbi:MAG: hypothetical protein RL122_1905 [Pseudomonadota bacterium]|jgi:hypothetical protein